MREMLLRMNERFAQQRTTSAGRYCRRARQVVRVLRLRASGEMERRADNPHAKVGTDANRNHVLCHLLAETNAGVVALRDDVGQAIVDVEFDLDVGIL
jgi:hypothetical protein